MNLIVLDIDDTITKSEYQHQLAFIESMKYFGITDINTNWREYKHHTDSYILLKNYERNLKDQFEMGFLVDFEQKMSEKIKELKPVVEINGAKQIINLIKKTPNYAICFATGSLLKPAIIKLNQIELEYEQQLVVGSNDNFDREGIILAAIESAKAYYQVQKFETILSVGDGIWDLLTARNLSIAFMGIGLKNLADFNKEKIKLHIEDWTKFDFNKAKQVFQLS